jgi:preprotein translocase subunit SecF
MQILRKTNINFTRWRWHALVLSLLIVIAGGATIARRGGLPLGIDFSGGTIVRVRFERPVTPSAPCRAKKPFSRSRARRAPNG